MRGGAKCHQPTEAIGLVTGPTRRPRHPEDMKKLAEVTPPDGYIVDPRFELINRWTFLMMQVSEAKEFLQLAETTHMIHPQSTMAEVLTQQALFRGFILSYAKCFMTNGKGPASLDPAKVFEGAANCLPIHESILHYRHKFAAHGDESGLEEAVIADVHESTQPPKMAPASTEG